PAAAAPVLPVVHTKGNWRDLVLGEERAALEAALREALPAQRWFAAKGSAVRGVTILDGVPIDDAWLVFARVTTTQAADAATYVFLLSFLAGEQAAAARHDRPAAALAELAIETGSGTTSGVCVDACSEPRIAQALLDAISRRRRIAGEGGHLVGGLTRKGIALRGDSGA